MMPRIEPQDQRRRTVRLDLSLQHIVGVALVKGVPRQSLVAFICLDRIAGRTVTDLGRVRNLLAGLGVVAEQRIRRFIARYPLRVQRRVFFERNLVALFVTEAAAVRLGVPADKGVAGCRYRVAAFYRDFRAFFILLANRALARIAGNIRQIVQVDLPLVTIRFAADCAVHMPLPLVFDDIPLNVLRIGIPEIFAGLLIILLIPAIDGIPRFRRNLPVDFLNIRLGVDLGNVIRQIRHPHIACIVRTGCIGNRCVIRRTVLRRLRHDGTVVADKESNLPRHARIRCPARIERIGLRILCNREHIGHRRHIIIVAAINLVIPAVTPPRCHRVLVGRPALEVVAIPRQFTAGRKLHQSRAARCHADRLVCDFAGTAVQVEMNGVALDVDRIGIRIGLLVALVSYLVSIGHDCLACLAGGLDRDRRLRLTCLKGQIRVIHKGNDVVGAFFAVRRLFRLARHDLPCTAKIFAFAIDRVLSKRQLLVRLNRIVECAVFIVGEILAVAVQDINRK